METKLLELASHLKKIAQMADEVETTQVVKQASTQIKEKLDSKQVLSFLKFYGK